MSRPKYYEGAVCVVTGDSEDWNHWFAAGTEVTLKEIDAVSGAWLCEPHEKYQRTEWCAGEPTPGTTMSDESWWVKEGDLAEAPDPPTDEEILRLFGLAPVPHCTTCTCHTKG